MLSVLANRTYRHLFLAQIIALIGTGLATVALGLLAYDIAGGSAGAVLGTALAIKMVAYIGVAPIAGAFTNREDVVIALGLASGTGDTLERLLVDAAMAADEALQGGEFLAPQRRR